MNFTDLIEEYWQEQKGISRGNKNELDDVITHEEQPAGEDQAELEDTSEDLVVPVNLVASGNDNGATEMAANEIESGENLDQVVMGVDFDVSLSETLDEGNSKSFLQTMNDASAGAIHENVIDSSFNYQSNATVSPSRNGVILSKATTSASKTSSNVKKKYNPVECDVCHKVLSSRNSWREHRITMHLKNGKFPCDQCDKRFTHKRALLLHQVMHTGERNYVCEECGSTHKRQRELHLHIRDMHTNTQNFRCDVCFMCFKMKGQLKKHCFTEHKDTVTSCIVCKHKLTTPFSIYTHCLKHYEPKEFTCEQCGKAFKSKAVLKKHLPIHDPNRKPFKECPKCNKLIYSRSHYYEHVQSHDQNTNNLIKFQCDLCESSFQHLSSLKRHALRHRPGGDLEHPVENPYLNMPENELPSLCCRVCRKLYTSTSGYYDHIKRCPQGVRTIETCPLCGRTYSSKKTLRRHMRQRHADEFVENAEQPKHEVVCENEGEVDETEEIAIQIIALAPAVEENVVIEGEFLQDDSQIIEHIVQ